MQFVMPAEVLCGACRMWNAMVRLADRA